jgi:phospholipase C
MSTANDPIQHVVVLLLENRSFDQMLGCFSEVYGDLDGIDRLYPGRNSLPPGSPGDPRRQQDFAQQPTTLRQMPWRKPDLWDPHHEVPHVRTQINGPPARPEQMGGFIADFVAAYPDSTDEARQYIMDYFPLDFLPALHALGRDFTICDRWFSSLPGPTWPNRFFALSGTASGRVDMPGDGTYRLDVPGYFHQQQPTLFDRLNERGIHWKSYFHDLPQSWALGRARLPHTVARYFYIDEFFADARAHAEDFPQFCYIEPDFLGFQQNDDHPPHDVMKGEKLVADIYNALRGNRELWPSTLLVIFFDEHGGFYDHVYPPPALPPDPPGQARHELPLEMLGDALARINPWHKPAETYSFDQLGVRVPALLVSPWVKRGVAKVGGLSPVLDHTSLLRYLTDKWNLGPLGLRTAQAQSIGALIGDSMRPDGDMIAKVEMPVFPPVDPQLEDAAFGITEHDKALQNLAAFLWLVPKAAIGEAAVETLPRAFVLISSLFEGLRFGLRQYARRLAERTFGWGRRPRASVGDPDKIHTDTATTRDDAAWFLMRRKTESLATIGDEMKADGIRREHAVRTLAVMTGRPFHKESHARATQWLAEHGRE